MKYILIILLLIAFNSNAQTWTTVTSLEYSSGRINAYNSLGKQIFQVNCKDMVYIDRQNGDINIYDYKNDNNNLIVGSKLLSPLFANVKDSLDAWIAQCSQVNQFDSLVQIISKTTDSIYYLEVSNGVKQLDGTIDSFDCSSVKFVWQTIALGTVTITGSDGSSLSYTPLDILPNWQVNEPNKLGKIYVDATSATGLRAIYQGCEAPCFKKIQITDCTTGTPIILGDFNNDFNNDFLK